MMKKLNNLKTQATQQANLVELFQELRKVLKGSSLKVYLKDFYTQTEASQQVEAMTQTMTTQQGKKSYTDRVKPTETGIYFLEMNLSYRKINEQDLIKLIDEIMEELEQNPETPAPTPTPTPKTKKAQTPKKAKRSKAQAKDSKTQAKPTHRNKAYTAAEQHQREKEIQNDMVEKLKTLDTEKIINFDTYSFHIFHAPCDPEVLELNVAGIENGKVRFRGYINGARLNDIDQKAIEQAVTKGHQAIQKTWKEHMKKLEKERDKKGRRWSMGDIRDIMTELDSQTGLNGRHIPYKLSKAKRKLAHFTYTRTGEPLEFAFTEQLLTYATYDELLDVVIHEYCHYWQTLLEGKSGHNKNFKALCQKLGGSGSTYFKGFSELENKDEE